MAQLGTFPSAPGGRVSEEKGVAATWRLASKLACDDRALVATGSRDVWDVDAAGSNPVTPTKIADLTAFCGQIGTNLICHRRQNTVVFNCRIRCPSELGLLLLHDSSSIFIFGG